MVRGEVSDESVVFEGGDVEEGGAHPGSGVCAGSLWGSDFGQSQAGD